MKTNKLAIPVRIISVLKACRNHPDYSGRMVSSHFAKRGPIASPPPLKPPSSTASYGNPCLDLFFKVFADGRTAAKQEANCKYLKQLLPRSWSHNPLTTLKLIANLLHRIDIPGKGYDNGFHTAAIWLHHNHPKTLAANVPLIAGSFGCLNDCVETLYRILSGQEVRDQYGSTDEAFAAEDKMIKKANKAAVDRYDRYLNYQLLHDRVSDLFAHCISRDIRVLKKPRQVQFDHRKSTNEWLEITLAAAFLDDRASFLVESVAKKLFPRESYPEYGGVEDADYARRVVQRLKKEVLVPLKKATDPDRGYKVEVEQVPDFAAEYLAEVKSGAKIAAAGDLLPHDIVRFVNDEGLGHLAELQWEAATEDLYLKLGELKNCMAVFDVAGPNTGIRGDVAVALSLMMAQFSQEPWKGKVINFGLNPKLHCVKGQDLKSKCEFLRTKMAYDEVGIDFGKVFDLILETAAKANLKAEQMVKNVVVFTDVRSYSHYDESFDYRAVQSKFKDKGYGEVVPHLVFWNVKQSMHRPAQRWQGVTVFSGCDKNLVKAFLDNDGEIRPEHIMEAAIAGENYQNLVLVD